MHKSTILLRLLSCCFLTLLASLLSTSDISTQRPLPSIPSWKHLAVSKTITSNFTNTTTTTSGSTSLDFWFSNRYPELEEPNTMRCVFQILQGRGGKHVYPGQNPFHRGGEILWIKLIYILFTYRYLQLLQIESSKYWYGAMEWKWLEGDDNTIYATWSFIHLQGLQCQVPESLHRHRTRSLGRLLSKVILPSCI